MATEIQEALDRLARFEPVDLPVLSLYLNTQANEAGRTRFEPFVRKELPARARTYGLRTPERESIERDIERIGEVLNSRLEPSAQGAAIFACAGKDNFLEALMLDAPIEENQLFVGREPHLYELAKLLDQYRRYVAVVADTNSARLFVFGLNTVLTQDEVQNVKMSRTQVGGWSQARYQRHVENFHQQHAKEVAGALEKLVKEEGIDRIVFAGDEVIVPMLKQELPQHLEEKVVDVLRLDIRESEREVLRATLEAMREQDARDDAEAVRRMLDGYRSGGLATAGLKETLRALEIGQVDELLVSAQPGAIRNGNGSAAETVDAFTPDELVTRARQTGAGVRFIEDASLLEDVGGVGALLRYRLEPAMETA